MSSAGGMRIEAASFSHPGGRDYNEDFLGDCEAVGALITLNLGIGWLQGHWISNRPLFLIGIFFLLSGIQFIIFGLLAELFIYSNARDGDYGIAEVVENVTHGSDVAVVRQIR